MATKYRRKYNHGKFLSGDRAEIADKNVLPGMTISFLYNVPTAYDKTPIVFVIHTDDKYHYGYNLRYLTENNVKLVLTRLFNFTNPVKENKIRAREPYVRAVISSKFTPSFVDGNFIYRNLKTYPMLTNSYRTYNINKISNLEIVPLDYNYFGYVVEDKT